MFITTSVECWPSYRAWAKIQVWQCATKIIIHYHNNNAGHAIGSGRGQRRPLMDGFQSVVSISFSSSWSSLSWSERTRFVSNPRAFGVARQELVASGETRVTILIYRKKHMRLARANPSRARLSVQEMDWVTSCSTIPELDARCQEISNSEARAENGWNARVLSSKPAVGGAYLGPESFAHWSNSLPVFLLSFSFLLFLFCPPPRRAKVKEERERETYSHFLPELIRPVCVFGTAVVAPREEDGCAPLMLIKKYPRLGNNFASHIVRSAAVRFYSRKSILFFLAFREWQWAGIGVSLLVSFPRSVASHLEN